MNFFIHEPLKENLVFHFSADLECNSILTSASFTLSSYFKVSKRW